MCISMPGADPRVCQPPAGACSGRTGCGRELGLGKYCCLRCVILLSYLLLCGAWVRSHRGMGGQDVADQVKDLPGKAACPCGGRQQEVPWTIRQMWAGYRIGRERRSSHSPFKFFTFYRSSQHWSIFSSFPIFPPTPPPIHPPDQKKIERYCFASDRSQGTVHSL